MNASTWFSLVANAALPAYAAFRYAQFALAPGDFDETYSWALVTLFMVQLPLCLLGAVFAGVSYIEGPSWRRILVYLGVLGVVAIVAALFKIGLDADFAPIIGYAIAMQVVILMFVGKQPALALARIEAVTNDAANLIILCIWGGVIAALGALILQDFARGRSDWHELEFELSDLAWIGAVYFLLRAWSSAYAYILPFEARRKGFFQRPWIETVTRLGRKPPSTDDY